mgnify:FL=1
MTKKIYSAFALSILLSFSLTSCGDSGGDRAEGVEPGPPPSGGNPVEPPIPPTTPGIISVDDITASDDLNVDVVGLTLNTPPTIIFNVLVNDTMFVNDFTSSNARFTLAKLIDNPGSSKGQSWQSYVLTSEDPICREQADVDDSSNECTSFTSELDPSLIADSARKVQDEFAIGKTALSQASSENSGTFVDNENGTWRYTFTSDIADAEQVDEVHRACIQFSLNASALNNCIDFVPSIVVTAANGETGTSLESDFYQFHQARKIVNEQSCNSCHAELTMHGSRTQTDYCVTCHNPSSFDANSSHSVDFKEIVHKIHFGRELPSLKDDNTPYKIWGYKNGEHDYSKTSYPQDVMICSRCHAGEEDIEFAQVQGVPLPKASTTLNGHNWVETPTKLACQSCHEKLFSDNLKLNGNTPSTNHTSFTIEKDCAGCHRDRGADEPGGVQANQAHRDVNDELGRALTIVINQVENTGKGEFPKVTFSIVDKDNNRLDLINSADMCASASYDLRMPNDAAKDYRGRISASGDMSTLAAEGDNLFSVTLTSAVSADIDTIAAMLDFSFPSDCGDSSSAKVRLDATISYAASNAQIATSRRQIVDVAQCNNCHGRFLLTSQKHSGLRAVNSPETCIACHGSEFATYDRSRELGVLVHSIHATAKRESPHGGWDIDLLQYPGELKDCTTCHINGAYTLPLPLVREPIKTSSSTYSTAIGAVCSGCHDSAIAKSHMVTAGSAAFDVEFDSAASMVESCDVCHGSGKAADVDVVHK